jgi:hypothetical protein
LTGLRLLGIGVFMILNQLRIALEVLVAKRRSRSRGLGGRRLGQLVEELPAALRFPVELKRPNAKIAEDVGWIADPRWIDQSSGSVVRGPWRPSIAYSRRTRSAAFTSSADRVNRWFKICRRDMGRQKEDA